MTGNIALDVVIGLVFIYLLYSLYATVLMEIISSFFGLRAKNLRYTISRMLKDEKTFECNICKWAASIATTFLRSIGLSANLKNPELYKKFFNQPNIKYLGSGGFGGKPSYLTAENFSKALIDSIKTDDPDLSVMAAFEDGLTKNLAIDSETRKHLQSLMDDANNDLIKFKILVESWFNDTMDRSIGWFKQTTQIILALIGLILVINFNIDTIAIIKKLSRDENAREQMVKMATDFTEKKESILNAIKTDTSNAPKKELAAYLDSLQLIKQSLNEDMQNAQTLLSAGWNIPEKIYFKEKPADTIPKGTVQIAIYDSSRYIILPNSVDVEVIKSMLPKKRGKEEIIPVTPFYYKLHYVFNLAHIWGYLLTVLALSLGAPFWFDLLNKLVQLRTSKPADGNTDSKAGNTPGNANTNRSTLNRVG